MKSETIHAFLAEAFEPERAERILEFVQDEFGGRPDTAQRATVAMMAIISAMLPHEDLAHEILKTVYEECEAAKARSDEADQETHH
jgi:hypothetical protein